MNKIEGLENVSGVGDVTEYLVKGKNKIKITVATSLLNTILLENKNILNGDGRVLDDRHNSSYGLKDEVYISTAR